MGRRYAAILEHLGHEWGGEDLGPQGKGSFGDSDAIIIATPTSTHADLIRKVMWLGKPILCEKPICKDMGELRNLMSDCVKAGARLQVVSQYDYLVRQGDQGPTQYDYFKTGPDGLPWDCIQIVDHARDTPTLKNKSPVWHCVINGKVLNLADMDGAYVRMIDEWLARPRNDISRILESHAKCAALEASWQQKS